MNWAAWTLLFVLLGAGALHLTFFWQLAKAALSKEGNKPKFVWIAWWIIAGAITLLTGLTVWLLMLAVS